MFEAIAVIVVLIAGWVVYEYRLRLPDQLILTESKGTITERKSRFYPRHFCLALPNITHAAVLTIETAAKGNLDIKIRLAYTVAASLNNITPLIRVGGWKTNAVAKAAKELDTVLFSIVKEYAEKNTIEELSSEKTYKYIKEHLTLLNERFGLELVSLTVQSVDASDPKISEALKQQESARIFEQTEKLNQQARIGAARAKFQADEELANLEHELELKRATLRQAELIQEAALAKKRTEEELARKKMQLEYDSAELELLKKNPELLMLTPQAARLAEASQSMKNARTVVSFGGNDSVQNTELLALFRNFLESAFHAQAGSKISNGE